MNRYSVFIASPYTYGNKLKNVQTQMLASSVLIHLGFQVYTPLLTHFSDEYLKTLNDNNYPPVEEKQWINLGLSYVSKCHILVRLLTKDENGDVIESNGSDNEETEARDNNLKIYKFNTVDEMKSFFTNNYNYIIDELITKYN